MLRPDQIYRTHSFNLTSFSTPFIVGRTSCAPYSTSIFRHSRSAEKHSNTCIQYKPSNIKAVVSPSSGKSMMVKGVISVQPTISSALADVSFNLLGMVADRVTGFLGRSFFLELVSVDLDSSGKQKETVKAYASYDGYDERSKLHKYRCKFEVPEEFGEIGAILVENEYHKEMFIKNIVLDDDDNVIFPCESWIQSKHVDCDKRIFFTTKSYLPSETPEGLKRLREKDLESLRGNGEGERKYYERVYDYDMYNDIGDPDTCSNFARPVLGGEKHPYPRRCRTGRKMTSIEPWTESRTPVLPFYVPRDEDFSEIKGATFGARTLYSVLHAAIPIIDSILTDRNKGFSLFRDIELLYDQDVDITPRENGFLSDLRRFIRVITNTTKSVLQFETPRTRERDPFSWLRDEEYCRQTLAGLNPYSIQLVKEWPLMSKLDPKIYGPAESAITKEIVEQELKGFMTFEEAMEQKRLFCLDRNDLLLKYVNKGQELQGTPFYGSRMLMFLTTSGTLTPLAIELTRPPNNTKPQWKHVYTPSSDATGAWIWKLAKAHVLAHDFSHHELVSHWLRTHCVTEPYIISANRHLSKMHPIYRLLSPHFRYTMMINGIARQALINAGGTIEYSFSLGRYAMQFSSDAYDEQWRFDHDALPVDLISRGMAIEDKSAPHGLKLTIEDYPFANDGLLIWDAIKQWATSYINHYYPQPNLVESDEELQAWWTEIRTVGHGDKKDEPWWPQLKTQQDLITIVSTIMWVSSGHHSAVNFGQYDYAGYFPNRPSIARTKMPDEDPTTEEWEAFMKKPEDALLNCFPSQIQATRVMFVLDVISSHSLDEEYIGANMEVAWEVEPVIKAAFEEFNRKMKEIEGVVDSRNNDPSLRNRNGAGVVPYELLKPYSEPGVTGKGVANSISI